MSFSVTSVPLGIFAMWYVSLRGMALVCELMRLRSRVAAGHPGSGTREGSEGRARAVGDPWI
jgi:hypothetical protein